MAGSFFCIFCKSCGWWFIQETRKNLMTEVKCTCKHCSKTFNLFIKRRVYNGAQARFFGPYDCREASQIIQQIKKDEATEYGKYWVAELSEFETYEVKQ